MKQPTKSNCLTSIREQDGGNIPDRICSDENKNGSDKDLVRLRDTASRLRLKTRSQSYIAWKAIHMKGEVPDVKLLRDVDCRSKVNVNGETRNRVTDSEGRRLNIDEALSWIWKELYKMRATDQTLAKQLLSIRHDILEMKLKWSCEEHADMLAEVTSEMEEVQLLRDVCDLPVDIFNGNPLKHLGVTKMNLYNRRFSTC